MDIVQLLMRHMNYAKDIYLEEERSRIFTEKLVFRSGLLGLELIDLIREGEDCDVKRVPEDNESIKLRRSLIDREPILV